MHYIPLSCTSSPCNLLFLNPDVYGLVQATVGIGTVLIWDFCVAYTKGGGVHQNVSPGVPSAQKSIDTWCTGSIPHVPLAIHTQTSALRRMYPPVFVPPSWTNSRRAFCLVPWRGADVYQPEGSFTHPTPRIGDTLHCQKHPPFPGVGMDGGGGVLSIFFRLWRKAPRTALSGS